MSSLYNKETFAMQSYCSINRAFVGGTQTDLNDYCGALCPVRECHWQNIINEMLHDLNRKRNVRYWKRSKLIFNAMETTKWDVTKRNLNVGHSESE